MSEVVDNKTLNRFELEVDGDHVIAAYRIADGAIYFTHTQTPARLRGRGLAGQVVHAALQSAQDRGLKIVPLCSYVADYLEAHPEFAS